MSHKALKFCLILGSTKASPRTGKPHQQFFARSHLNWFDCRESRSKGQPGFGGPGFGGGIAGDNHNLILDSYSMGTETGNAGNGGSAGEGGAGGAAGEGGAGGQGGFGSYYNDIGGVDSFGGVGGDGDGGGISSPAGGRLRAQGLHVPFRRIAARVACPLPHGRRAAPGFRGPDR